MSNLSLILQEPGHIILPECVPSVPCVPNLEGEIG